MATIADQLQNLSALNQMAVPDLWQQEAIGALRAGKDVVVQAPTGAGKTLIFELWSNGGKNRGQAIYTVPTRALANDKMAEWRARGWDVGIATGDLAENLDAPVIVATLETQKRRLIRGDGPVLLVVDEYQMIGDADRGLNYELAIALAPAHTQLLLLSGSVANPHHVVDWLERLGRKAVLIKHEHRPVPLDEVYATNLSFHVPAEIKGYWPRLVAKALAEDLGPVLIFSPRRQAAEALAAELTRFMPNPNPLTLTHEQKLVVGDHLGKMLKSRIAYHHSGLSYVARAGVVEPLAKAGQLRVVVATMGLAAGINFSLRSVALAGDSYRRNHQEQPLRGDEILQMFGRAGRRGLDETGYVIVTANQLRLIDARPAFLSRGGTVDWGALLGVMKGAAELGREPFLEAVKVQQRLFTIKPIVLGVEEALLHPVVPCGLMTDAERARHVRHRVRQIMNSAGEWENAPPHQEKAIEEIRKITVEPGGHTILQPVLTFPIALQKTGVGNLIVVDKDPSGLEIWGRSVTVAEKLPDGHYFLAKWVRRLVGWNGRKATAAQWDKGIAPELERKLALMHTPVLRFVTVDLRITAQVSLAKLKMKVAVDRHGIAIWKPTERDVLPTDCAVCSLVPVCNLLSSATGVALLWRRMGLVLANGEPTLRGQIVSCFGQGDGLAIAAGLEENTYPLSELIYDIANLDAGFRFCGEENRWAGRLAQACHHFYGSQSIPGYLENGVPPRYGAGAELIVSTVHKNPSAKYSLATDLAGIGDIDRLIIEWRSLLRQIGTSPAMLHPRWTELQVLARSILNETESPTLTDLPPLEFSQTRRVNHQLTLRRH
ncbi:MAG: box helicase domain protein [Verrucomicrobiales bacterium]|nr:box helicase domain protein [Verrucomicrobiales bacterium]